jgi:hypothetical protein
MYMLWFREKLSGMIDICYFIQAYSMSYHYYIVSGCGESTLIPLQYIYMHAF